MRRNNKNLKVACGSLTVEAALVLPIYIYIMIAFLYFLQIIRLQEMLQNAITETGFFTAKYAYVYDYIKEYETEEPEDNKNLEEDTSESSIEAAIAKTIDSTFYKIKMKDYLNVNLLNQFCIKGGYSGIHTNLSAFMDEEEAIDIILTYDIRLPLLFIHIKDIPMMQRVRLRGWSGHKVSVKTSSPDSTNGNEQMVYITQTGTVYHLYKDCTYLKLSIKEVNLSQVDALRNDSGGKYKKCNVCEGAMPPDLKTVYITNTGDRYHWNLSCSGLKRTILTVPISEIRDRSLCSRCGTKE